MGKSVKLLDNKSLGTVVAEFKKDISDRCTLSVLSTLFLLYAYDELAKVSKFKLLVPCYGDKKDFFESLSGNRWDRRLHMYRSFLFTTLI